MKTEDSEFIEEIIDKSSWLFYGDLDETFDKFVKKVFSKELKDWGFGGLDKESDNFKTAYWLFVSELQKLELAGYGTSPRGMWLNEKGKRFKNIIMNNKNVFC